MRIFIVAVTYYVKRKPHLRLRADNEHLVDTRRDLRKKSKEPVTGKRGESKYRWNSRRQVCRCRWERIFGLWLEYSIVSGV